MIVLQRYHVAYKEVGIDNTSWSVCTDENNGNLTMKPLWMLDEKTIFNLPHFEIPLDNQFELKRITTDEILKKWKEIKWQK